jgi:hypothetical protein
MEATMNTKKMGFTLNGRLETGAKVLLAAREVDTTLVKARLSAFGTAQRSYEEAHRQVAVADSRLRAGQVRLAQCDKGQDTAVERLARALVTAGQPRANPFAAFGRSSPYTIRELNAVQKIQAIQQLVTAVQRQRSLDPVALGAARAAGRAAESAAVALLAVDRLTAIATSRRRARENIAVAWKTTFDALKLGARSADIDGAPGIYSALFGQPSRVRKKAVKPAAQPQPEVNQAAQTMPPA